MRTCTKCGVDFPETEEHFYVSEGRLRPNCKSCQRAASKRSRDARLSPEQLAAREARQLKATEKKRLKELKADRERRGVKVCKTCLQEFPATREYFVWHNLSDTPRAHCYTCHAANTRKWNAENAELLREINARARAKRECTVPQRWVRGECPDHLCYWCGIETFTDVDMHHPQFRDLEHLHPVSKGGEAKPYNEAWACRECNRGRDGKFDKHPLVWIAEQF